MQQGPAGRLAPSAGRAHRVLVGEFGRAHGLKGEVRLKSFTADPLAIAAYGPLAAADGRSVTLRSVRQAPGAAPDLLIAQVDGVASRSAAEALNRVPLFLARERLPLPEAEDEFLLADLIGLAATGPGGEPIGTIVAVPNFGGGDLLEIALEIAPGIAPGRPGATALVPFTRSFVPVVDIARRHVVVDAPDSLLSPAPRPEPGNGA